VNAAAVVRIRQEVSKARRILLTTHQNPDGDGLGSEIALASYLKSVGKTPVILNPDPIPDRYRFLDPAGEARAFDEGSGPETVRSCDLMVMLDNSSLNRLGGMEGTVRESSVVRICIDHHDTTDSFWTVNLIDETACATGEMIFDLVTALGGTIDLPSATAIYTALVTDTGHFRFSKTSPRSHRIAAELLRMGVDPARIYQEVYEQHAEGFVRLMGMALADCRLESGGALAWIAVTRKQIVECRAEEADTSEMVNQLFGIRGVRLCLLFKELSDGRVKVSLRSKGTLDVNRVAGRYGGGGHQNAAGAVLGGPLEDAIRRMVTDAGALLP
jgi:bifunctional oligoribonuclease and PAP phosphatase NrnA